MDCSLGNALYPMRRVANYAFRQTAKDLNHYQLMNGGSGDESLRNILISIADYFTARGIHAPGWSGLGLRDMVLTGGGTTEAFNMIVQMLADDVRTQNKQHQRTIKPAILMPVPTYGFFADAARRQGLVVMPVRRDVESGGHLNIKNLTNAIRKANRDGLRIVAYYDSNPNNPCGLVRGEGETRQIGQILRGLGRYYARQDDEALCQRLEGVKPIDMGGFMMKPGAGYRWDGPASRVCMIDDMVYDGLEYGDQKPFSFAQVPEFFEDTLALFGPSKAGLANLRAGLVLGGRRYIQNLDGRAMMNQYFPSKPALHAIEAYFSTKKNFVKQRKDHLDQMNSDHRFRGLLMKALINGIESMPELNAQDISALVKTVMTHKMCDHKTADLFLKQKIPGIRVVTTPQAGFFHMLDFSGLRGRLISNDFVPYKRAGGQTRVEDEEAIHHVLGGAVNLRLAAGTWTGLDANEMMARVTFAMPVADIFDVVDRLRCGMKSFVSPVNESAHQVRLQPV